MNAQSSAASIETPGQLPIEVSIGRAAIQNPFTSSIGEGNQCKPMMDVVPNNNLSKLKLYSDEELKNRRAAAKRGKKLIEALNEVLVALDADAATLDAVQTLDRVVDRLNPPDLKKCKEYVRALKRSQKALPGIDPEDVVLYCNCAECRDVRDRFGLDQPSDEDAEQLLERKIAEKLSEFESEREASQADEDAKTA